MLYWVPSNELLFYQLWALLLKLASVPFWARGSLDGYSRFRYKDELHCWFYISSVRLYTAFSLLA